MSEENTVLLSPSKSPLNCTSTLPLYSEDNQSLATFSVIFKSLQLHYSLPVRPENVKLSVCVQKSQRFLYTLLITVFTVKYYKFISHAVSEKEKRTLDLCYCSKNGPKLFLGKH